MLARTRARRARVRHRASIAGPRARDFLEARVAVLADPVMTEAVAVAVAKAVVDAAARRAGREKTPKHLPRGLPEVFTSNKYSE